MLAPSCPSILLVLSESPLRRNLATQFEARGYVCRFSAKPVNAVQMCRNEEFAAVLIDAAMGLEGQNWIGALREAIGQNPSVLLALAQANELGERLVAAGADDFAVVANHGLQDLDLTKLERRFVIAETLRSTQQRLVEISQRLELAALASNDGIWDWDVRSNHVDYSPRWRELIGFAADDAFGNTPEDWWSRVHPADLGRLKTDLSDYLIHGQSDSVFSHEHRLLTKSGSYQWMNIRGMAVRDHEGKVTRMAGSLALVREHGVYDSLTRLPTRELFMGHVRSLLGQGDPTSQCALLYIGLDRLQVINDSKGHLAGDEVLRLLAGRIEALLRPGDFAARYSGDEFTIFLANVVSQEGVEAIADLYRKALAEPITVRTDDLVVTVSIGFVLAHPRQLDVETMIQRARAAFRQAKRSGRNRSVAYIPGSEGQSAATLEISAGLRRAIDNNEFRLAFQPIVALKSGKIVGFEALLRWKPRSRGGMFSGGDFVSPGKFIPIAEESGLIVEIGEWVMREAANQLTAWARHYGWRKLPRMSINISPKQFAQANLVVRIREILATSQVPTAAIKLEITESMLIENTAAALKILEALSQIGLQLSVDDFGTGYSSLSYLHKFPLHTLKIDQSFVRGIVAEEDKREISRTIIMLAHNLGMDVVAEGIENNEQQKILKKLKCEYGQGMLICRPQTAEDIQKFIQKVGVQGVVEV